MSSSEEEELLSESARSLSPITGNDGVEGSSSQGAAPDLKDTAASSPPPPDDLRLPSSLLGNEEDEAGSPSAKSKQSKSKPGAAVSFPRRLMDVLSREDTKEGIVWQPDGKSFAIVNPRIFASSILPRFFKQSKFQSFVRKLNRWGFKRVNSGSNSGSFYHYHFQRDNPDLCLQMHCRKPGSSGVEMSQGMLPPQSPSLGRKRRLSLDQTLEPSPLPPGYYAPQHSSNLGSMLIQSLPGEASMGGDQNLFPQATMGGMNMMPTGAGFQGNLLLQQQRYMQHQHMMQQQRMLSQLGQASETGNADALGQMSAGTMGVGAMDMQQHSMHRQQQLLADLEMQQRQLEVLQQQLRQQQQQQMQEPQGGRGPSHDFQPYGEGGHSG